MQRPIVRLRSAWLPVLVASAVLGRAQGPPSYEVEFLGPAVNVAGFNEAGVLVGTTTFGPNLRAWIARSGSPLAPLPLPPGRISSSASDVNELGAVVGAVGSNYSPEFGGVAAVWLPDGSGGYAVVELGMLPGHIRSHATALNDVGDVVGYSATGMFRYPVLFDVGGAPIDLSSTGIFDPRSINDQRVLVDGSFTAKRLDLDTMIVEDLGVPTGLPTNYVATSAATINASGQVAGLAIMATSTDCDRQAARYTDEVGWEIFSSCGSSNGAYDMNDRGDMVMRLNVAPYVFFEGLGTFRIEDLIVHEVGHWYVINGFGLGINGARQIACAANNQVTGESGIVLLTPIEPGATAYCSGDGSGTACPCGNSGAPSHGCANGRFPTGAGLVAIGHASVSADSLVLDAARSTPSQPGLFFQGNDAVNGGAGIAFGDGLRCAGGSVVRLETVMADASGGASSSIGIAARGGNLAGDLRRYQWWYRDPLLSPCGSLFNLSNGVELRWVP